ncbi:MAG: prolyl aminopeptidase [Hyphomicrobium sp.]|nr:prolyl aminopeptidase [Hyphomicrobium sp.]
MTTHAHEALRPFDARMIRVSDGHWIYVEEIGRRGGRPCVFLHGGPGSGAQHAHRAVFNPARDHAFLFDQRGAGRSHPYLSCAANTTQHLVGDIEIIRAHFAIEKWLVVGGSWGSTLALAYAEAHPERVTSLVLRAIFLGTSREVEWAFIDAPKTFRPELYAAFRGWLPRDERHDPLSAYLRRLTDPDPRVHAPAAHVWNAYERILSEISPASQVLPAVFDNDARTPPTPIIEAHYICNGFFLEPGELLANATRLNGIPGTIIQGRYDLLCPPLSAHALTDAWPDATLHLIDAAGHAMTEPGVMDAMRDAISRMG